MYLGSPSCFRYKLVLVLEVEAISEWNYFILYIFIREIGMNKTRNVRITRRWNYWNKLNLSSICVDDSYLNLNSNLPLTLGNRANGRNIVGQKPPTLLDVTCCVRLHTMLHAVVSCRVKFETGQTLEPATPNISFGPWSPKRGVTHVHYTWCPSKTIPYTSRPVEFTKLYGLYPSHDAL